MQSEYTDKLTVCIPVFERYDYFEKAVRSIQKQSIIPKIIVVDNDSSHSKFLDFCNEENITYFKNDHNVGMFPNWNKCFECSQSDFVLILGDDDYMQENYIELFLLRLKEFPGMDVFFSDFSILCYPQLEVAQHQHIFPFGYMESPQSIQEFGIDKGLSFPVITSAIRKTKFKGFYSLEHGANDWEWAYLRTEGLFFFGEKAKLIVRGSHGSNDSGSINTRMKTSISMAYIYAKLAGLIENPELKKKGFVKANNWYLNFLYVADEAFIETLNLSDQQYAVYFKEIHCKKIGIRILLKLNIVFRKKLIGFLIRYKFIRL